MTTNLVRFGLAVDAKLLADFDALVEKRGCSRSELFRDLARAEVSRAQTVAGGDAVATLTILYDHHVPELAEKLTDFQHELGSAIRCTLHLHLNQHDCLEVIVMSGKADTLRAIGDRISATRGVKHGHIEIIAHDAGGDKHTHAADGHTHAKLVPARRSLGSKTRAQTTAPKRGHTRRPR
jgi:CopG family transcriptional regulator, nickel-responsive regulator